MSSTIPAPAPVTERVADGLWSIPVPIPHNPLGYTLVYLFETASGPVLVDAGWDDDTTWAALRAGMAEAGYEVAETYGVLVTHMHPDHHGLSGRVQDASGSWVAMHPHDARIVHDRHSADDDYVVQGSAVLLDAGASADEVTALTTTWSGRRSHLVQPDRFVEDGDRVDVPGWRVRAVWTPGHSPGHTCFVVEDHALLLSGDHVLPRITPHVSLGSPDHDGDPLGDYLDSLAKVAREDVREVLPAHEHRFHDLRARAAVIGSHHHERFDAIERLLAAGPMTLWRLAGAMAWNRPWDALNLFMKRAAVGETLAHLRWLERRGRVRRLPGVRPTTFEAVAPAARVLRPALEAS